MCAQYVRTRSNYVEIFVRGIYSLFFVTQKIFVIIDRNAFNVDLHYL